MEKMTIHEAEFDVVANDNLTASFTDDLMFEELEQRIVPMSAACATSSSCSCSSTSCIAQA